MTEICEKYHLNESHAQWIPAIDNWYSIEAARQQLGRLPAEGDKIRDVMMQFLDNKDLQLKLMGDDPMAFGSMYLSAKRALYRDLLRDQ